MFMVTASYSWFFGVATMFVWQARSMSKNAPICRATPVQLSDTAVSNSTGTSILVDGYRFEVPWRDAQEKESQQLPNWKSVTAMPSGPGVLVHTVPTRHFVNAVTQGTGSAIRTMFGAEALNSDYSFTKSMLETTPEQIRLMTPRKEAAARLTILLMKSIAVPAPAESGLYSIRTPTFYGFQYGDPRNDPKKVIVDLFNDDGGMEFVFVSKDGGQSISQADINRVIQSVQKNAAEIPAK
jgi:hypothetical protein